MLDQLGNSPYMQRMPVMQGKECTDARLVRFVAGELCASNCIPYLLHHYAYGTCVPEMLPHGCLGGTLATLDYREPAARISLRTTGMQTAWICSTQSVR